jgi:hypothetical protein
MPVVAIFLSCRSEPHPDQSELRWLCLTCRDGWFPWQRDVFSGRTAWRPSKLRQRVRITRISNVNRCRAQIPCNLRIAPITGLLPAAAGAIRRSSNIAYGQ